MKVVDIGKQDAIIWAGAKELSEHVHACTALLRGFPLNQTGEIVMGLKDGERIERVSGQRRSHAKKEKL
jgi:hypothetical protein